MSKTAFKQVVDNAVSTTATSLAATGVTSITLATGDGAKFPAPGNGFWITIWVGTSGSDPASDANMEKVLCSARSGDVLTIGATTKTHTGGTVQVGLLDVAANTTDMQTAINTIESAVGITSANALEILDLNSVTSAVNFLKGTNSIAAAPPILSVGGTDTNTGLIIASKGTGGVLVRPGTDWAGAFQVQDAAGANTALAVGTATRRVGANISAPTSSLHSGGSFATNLTSVSANTTLDETHSNVLVDASGAAKTITLPTAAGIAGRQYTIKKTDSSINAVTIATTSSQTIDGITTFVMGAQYQLVTVISDGSNWQILQGITEQASALGFDLFRQAIINGDCQVAQRPTASLSTSYQYGAVDRYKVKTTGVVSAGTIIQDTAAAVGVSGDALKISGVTISGGALNLLYSIESVHAVQFKNLIGSFAVKVRHDVGSAINYSINIATPTTNPDDYAAQTSVYSGANISVNSATNTTIKAEDVSLGDVSKGMQIQIAIACGAVTTKNFWLTEFQFNKGAMVGPFIPRPYDYEVIQCQRYYQTYIEPHMVGVVDAAGHPSRVGMDLPVLMRIAPTLTVGALPLWDGATATSVSSIASTYTKPHRVEFDGGSAATQATGRPTITYAAGGTTSITCEADI